MWCAACEFIKEFSPRQHQWHAQRGISTAYQEVRMFVEHSSESRRDSRTK